MDRNITKDQKPYGEVFNIYFSRNNATIIVNKLCFNTPLIFRFDPKINSSFILRY